MSAKKKLSRGAIAGDTKEVPGSGSTPAADEVCTLTILSHPDPARIGDLARLPELTGRGEIALSRTEPDFVKPGGSDGWPLADPFISRKPATLKGNAGGVLISRSGDGIQVSSDGTPV